MSSVSSSSIGISSLDQNTVLPASLFKNKKSVSCTLFVQDAKIDFQRLKNGQAEAIFTCEFGLGAASQWGIKEWGEGESRPLNRAVKLLNDRKISLWLMAKKDAIELNKKREGEDSYLDKFQKALKNNPLNIINMDSPLGQQFPSPYNKGAFDPDSLSTYYAVASSPYFDLPPEHFANISVEFPKDPRIIMLDGGVAGPVNRIFGYKFFSRLAMNGTGAAMQNPPYVIIESVYRPDLATFLKGRYPNEERLVLKHAASSRGEGVVVLNASDEKALDKDLKLFLSENSEFKKVSPVSICLVEKFISIKETSAKNVMGESVTRMVYLALCDRGKFEVHAIDGVKTIEDPSSHEFSHTKGLVKLSKWHSGNIVALNDDDLQLVQHRVAKEISAIAERAIQFDAQEAVKYFLTSDNHILNLIGVELFTPNFLCSYRSRYGEHQNLLRLSDEQCELLSALLQCNQSPLLIKRVFANCIGDIMQIFEGIPYAPKFHHLVKTFWDVCSKKGLRSSYEVQLKEYFNALFWEVKAEFNMERLIYVLGQNAE